ncbi:hypothetical protein J1614_001709 [Plenodomus biglobosus]|nr:hypothetical protein J1614_001709 [Plenodomus biglobosus]
MYMVAAREGGVREKPTKRLQMAPHVGARLGSASHRENHVAVLCGRTDGGRASATANSTPTQQGGVEL